MGGGLSDNLARGGTLQGGRVVVARENLYVARELKAVAALTVEPGAVWDGRWIISGSDIKGMEIRAIGGVGLDQLPPEARATAPRAVLESLPAAFDGDRLVAQPLLDFGPAVTLVHAPRGGAFPGTLLAH